MRFEWDPAKAAANQRKHGVSFKTATLVFADPLARSEQDRVERHEARWTTIGQVHGQTLLIVAHTVSNDDDDETEVIRIISARKAEQKERRRYEQGPR